LISKLCVWADTREHAVARMRRALGEYVVGGIRTNLPFHERLLDHPDFVRGVYDTGLIEREKASLLTGSRVSAPDRQLLAAAIALAAHHGGKKRLLNGGVSAGGTSPWLAAHRARLGVGRPR
jgi:acetyl-CoA carboxylase biotin carboxylase subunit